MPKSTRSKPTEITIKVFCCQKGCTLTTKGDWKNKTCWHCDSYVQYTRFPETSVIINGVDVTENKQAWHIVNEQEIEEE